MGNAKPHKVITNLVFFIFSIGCGFLCEASEVNQEPLSSVLLRAKDVYAVNSQGLFRASLVEREWKKLPTPNSMPLGGCFAEQGKPSSIILYFVRRGGTEKPAGTEISGLYVSKDNGKEWQLTTSAYDFTHVYLHPGGSVFAIAMAHTQAPTPPAANFSGIPATEQSASGKAQAYRRRCILVSTDLGRIWRDITGNIPVGVKLSHIFRDPDHPNQICLRGTSGRGLVLQADDERYEWKTTLEGEWRKQDQEEDEFFSPSYGTGTTLYMYRATLANYFDHPFGKRNEIPAFQIVPKQLRWKFKLREEIEIPITLCFLPDYPSVKLIDHDDETCFWGVRAVMKNGKRTSLRPRGAQTFYESADQDKTRKRYREDPKLKIVSLEQKNPYVRTINVSKFGLFSEPGEYNLQLFYHNSWLADRDRGEWIGFFAGPVIKVSITK